jgi:osmoprotectant transport system substrate-binding protein
MHRTRSRFRGFAIVAALMASILVLAACGSDSKSDDKGEGGKAGTVVVGSKNFPESQLIASMYVQVLEKAGYTVKQKFNIGSTELAYAALKSGDIDVYPEYAATALEYVNKGAGEATSDPEATTKKLNERAAADGIVALTPSSAQDQNAFVVTKATAEKYDIKNLSDLAKVSKDLVLGGPPECETRPFCAAGLKSKYGIEFKEVRALDVGGPVTVKALEDGTIQVGLLFSSDGTIKTKGFVVLDDDKKLQAADNVVALVKKSVDKPALRKALDQVDAALTTTDLIDMNQEMNDQKSDPADVAKKFLQDKGLL